MMFIEHSTLLSPPCHSECSEESLFSVIPLKAGVQVFQGLLDPGFLRGDGFTEFCKRPIG